MNKLSVELLAHHPHHVDAVVHLLHSEWGALAEWRNPSKLKDRIETRLQVDTVPLALIALENNRPVGTASIKIRELSSHPEKEFWIGDIVVGAESRGLGIGTMLMHAIIAHSVRLGLPELFLYTPDQENYYRVLGWQTIGYDRANGEDVVVMRYVINASQERPSNDTPTIMGSKCL